MINNLNIEKDNQRKINVDIPAGVEDGQHLRLRSQGDSGPRSGPKGDLFVVINISKAIIPDSIIVDLHFYNAYLLLDL